jgi:hypothetical protein
MIIVYIYNVFYINIETCIYHIIYIKNLNVLQIHLYNINIYFGLSSSGFQVKFNNIYILYIIHQVRSISQKILIHLGWIGIHQIQIKLSPLITKMDRIVQFYKDEGLL